MGIVPWFLKRETGGFEHCNEEINGEVPPHYFTNPIFQCVLITFLGSSNLEILTLADFRTVSTFLTCCCSLQETNTKICDNHLRTCHFLQRCCCFKKKARWVVGTLDDLYIARKFGGTAGLRKELGLCPQAEAAAGHNVLLRGTPVIVESPGSHCLLSSPRNPSSVQSGDYAPAINLELPHRWKNKMPRVRRGPDYPTVYTDCTECFRRL